MERLTEVYIDDNGGEFCALVGCKEVCEHGWTEDESGCRCDKVGEMQIRLAAYEDIGTPEQCAAGVALMQKQEQGLVVVLPDDDMLDIGNALEPIKLHSALRSELLKLELRKAQKPDSVSVLDYTIIAALHDVITRAEAENAIAND